MIRPSEIYEFLINIRIPTTCTSLLHLCVCPWRGIWMAQPQKFGLVKKMDSTTLQRKVLDCSAFKDDVDGDDDNKTSSFGRNPYAGKILDSSIEGIPNSSIVEDTSVFDYDGTYDSFKNKSTNITSALLTGSTSQLKKPQYINDLLKSAKVRELERERIFEKKIIKEQQMEGLHDETKFITTAYQKKLLESKKWDYEDNLADEIDKKTDVRGKGMAGFYENLLTKNIALGSDIATSALSAYTSGSKRQQKLIEGNEINRLTDEGSSTRDKNITENIIKTENSNKRLLDDTVTNVIDDRYCKKITTEENVRESNDDVALVATATINHDKKEDTILSAKERYLARKK